MKELFPPEKCPKCGAATVVMHYENGYRVECPNNPACDWYGEFHFDKEDGSITRSLPCSKCRFTGNCSWEPHRKPGHKCTAQATLQLVGR